MEPSGTTDKGGEVAAISVPTQQTGGDQSRLGAQGNASSRPLLDIINVIFAALGRTGSQLARVMSMARSSAGDPNSEPKRAKLEI